jgi:gliding motility-associated-like protein
MLRNNLVVILTMAVVTIPQLNAHQPSCAHGSAATAAAAGGEYVENKGQWDDRVLYRADFGLVALFAERDRLTFSLWEPYAVDKVHDAQHIGIDAVDALTLKGHAWRLWFEGASPAVQVDRSGMAEGYFNYFLGSDPARWASHVRRFNELRYRSLWPGVDLRLYDHNGGFKYDVELARAADVAQVRFRYEGLDAVRIGTQGELLFSTSVGEVSELAPVAWYADGAREPVECRFTLKEGTVGFRFGKGTDMARPVVIDPVLIASTLSGTGNIGTTQNYGHTATYDADGNIYTGAICFGQGYPATTGAFDVTANGSVDIAVSKLNPTGSALLFASYLGGNNGDYPHSLVVTPAGELTVYGTTASANYPVSTNAVDPTFNGGFTDIVVTKLNPTGTALVGSTYMGCPGDDGRNTFTSNYGDSYRGEVLSDALGRIYVASCTNANGFPTSPGAFQTTWSGGQDGVVFCLSPDLSQLVWGTYLGTAAAEMCFGIKLNSAGEVYVSGGTGSNAFPTTPGAFQPASNGGQEAFVAHFNANASQLLHCTHLGTTGADVAFFVQLDLDDNVYIFGQSAGGTLGIQPAGTYGIAGGGIFVAEFDATLSTQVFRTTLGPAGGFGVGMVPVAFLVDVCRNIYISGYNVGAGWAVTPGALYDTGGFYLAAYEPDMTNLIYGTYYIGADHVDGGTSRFDANGIVYQSVCTSNGFPTTPGAFSNVQPAGWDVGVFKIDFQVAGVNAAGASTLNQGCAPIVIDFSNASTGDTWIWDFGDGSPPVEEFAPSHAYTLPGVYTVTLIALDSLSCNLADTTYLQIIIGEQLPIDAAFTYVQTIDCDIMEITTVNQSTGNPLTWYWDMGDGTQYADTNVVHQFPGPGQYLVQLIAEDPTGCSDSDTVQVVIDIGPPLQVAAAFTLTEQPGCDQSLATCTVNAPEPTATYAWEMGDGTLLTGPSVTHLFTAPGAYTITLTATDPTTCNLVDTFALQLVVPPSEPVSAAFTAEQVFDCDNLLLSTQNTSTGSNLIFLWELGDGSWYDTENITHVFSGPGTYSVQLTVADALGCSPSQTVSTEVIIEPLVPVTADLLVAQFGNCLQQSVELTDLSTGDLIALTWDMGDGTVYNGQPPVHTYAQPGAYTITLTVTDLGCGQDAVAVTTVTVINELPVVLVGDTVVCPGGTATLVANGPPGAYLWSNGQAGPSITVDLGGIYSVTVTTDDCQGTAAAELIIGPEYDLGQEFEACPTEAKDLVIGLEGIAYTWSTGGSERVERVVGPGTYVFTVIDPLGCPHTDTVRVKPLDAEPWVFAPNAFTPDSDGVNDVFRVAGFGDRDVRLSIFNRWGEQLWQSSSKDIGWDGTYRGTFVKNDVYVYELRYTGVCDAEERRVLGHVSVLR